MGEEWISLNEFMKRQHIGYEVALQMIHNGEIEAIKTEGGRYKIKVGGNTVSKELYEKEKERRIQAETTLELVKNLLNKGVSTNENY